MHMKFTQKMDQSITFQATSSTCSCLWSFPPHKIENLSSWTSEVVSRVLTKGWRGGQEIDLKMEAGHDWSPDTRLQGCAGFLVADM